MIEISRYFAVPFNDPAISGEELRQFAENHLAKLNGLNQSGAEAGAHTALITPTQAAFVAFDEAISARADALATQEGGTVSKDDVVQLLKTKVRQREGRVRDTFGKGSPAYEEFFPRGLGEYNRVTVGQVKTLLDRLVEKATKYQAQLGAEVLAEFDTLRTRFVNARGDQMGGAGALAEARAKVSATRAVLERQLATNLLTLAIRHLGAPDRAQDYFTQSLLEGPTRQNEEAQAPTLAPTP